MSLAKYFFIPWIRQGLSSRIDSIEDAALLEEQRAKIQFSLRVNEKSDELIQKPVELFGPGDVVGIDQSIIVRTDPKNNVGDFEPNFFPMIEFWEEDFPWMITPARQEDHQWQPWVCLIVLKNPKNLKNNEEPDGEFFEPLHYDESRPTPYITVKDPPNSLPDLTYSWAWAHAQITAEDMENILELDASKTKQLIDTNPECIVSRLFCPRRLEPGILYTAFLVPTFETGRRAGLGISIADAKLLDMAWDINSNTSIEVPYYYRWEFRTGLRGDFEYLVRLLEPRPLDSRVGKRPINCTNPGFGISVPENIKPLELGLEGALKHVDSTAENCPEVVKQQLEEKLNIPETLQLGDFSVDNRPYVVSPIYGKWHAGVKMIKEISPPWIKEINLDPRHRTTANFGTEVIQSQQESLMHEAWRQIGAVEEANQRIREAQMAAELNKVILNNKLLKLPQNTFIEMTAPVHSRILSHETDANQRSTVKGYLDRTTLPVVVFDPGFRKTFRKRGIIKSRQREDRIKDKGDLLDRMNRGEVQGAGIAPLPDGSGSLNQILNNFRPSWAKGWLWKILKALPLVLLILFIIAYGVIFLMNQLGVNVPYTHPILLVLELLLAVGAVVVWRKTLPARITDTVSEEIMTPEFINTVNPPRDFPDSEEFRIFARSVQRFLNEKPAASFIPQPADLPQLHAHLVEALNPEKNILNKLKTRIGNLSLRNATDTIEPIMAAPEFTQAMYEPLRDLSQDYMLPGLEYIQQNTITLLETNRTFIEAYMVGLNVEFASELLWREYPTDLRSTCFRQFWDIAEVFLPPHLKQELQTRIEQEKAEELGEVADEDEREQLITRFIEEKWKEILKDINPIYVWKNALLGANRGESNQSVEDNLVLLIRGDLLKKYPNAVIYAVRAKWEEGVSRDVRKPDFTHIESELGEEGEFKVEFPIFRGTLKPDITFLGFNLTEEQARGSTQRYTADELGSTVENDPGWFFVIEERISESRFGLDAYLEHEDLPNEAAEWDDLSWAHFYQLVDGIPKIAISPSGYIDGAKPRVQEDIGVNTSSPPVEWGGHSANIAPITLQKPARIAVHADDMLPE